MNFTLLDLLIVGFIGYLTFKGFKEGFIDNLIGFGGLLLVLFIATQNMTRLADILNGYLQFNRVAATFTSLLMLVGGGWFLIHKVVAKLQLAINPPAKWKQADHAAGGVVGLVQGIILVSLFGMFFLMMPLNGRLKMEQERSVMLRTTLKLAPFAFDAFTLLLPGKTIFEQLQSSLGNENIIDSETDDLGDFIKPQSPDESVLIDDDQPNSNNSDAYYGPKRRK
ncbi:CvpA family protein [candidate division KSB1 bacterium]|nr:CvpA family protein [candidate division KSB1 bacterium]